MKAAAAVRAVLLATGAVALVSAAASALPEGCGSARALLVLATGVKIGLLGLAAHWSLASCRRLEAGHPTAGAWGLLGAGFAGLALGHLVLGLEQLASSAPRYPALSDAAFGTAQVLLAAALARFVGAYRSSGLFAEEGARRAWWAIGAAAVVIGGLLLATIVRLPAPWLVRGTDALYAVLDLAMLVPLAFLVRQARQLGGRVGRVWVTLLAGFAAFAIADVSLGYLHALQAEPSLLLAQLPFVLAYGLAAAGSRLQLALVGE